MNGFLINHAFRGLLSQLTDMVQKVDICRDGTKQPRVEDGTFNFCSAGSRRRGYGDKQKKVDRKPGKSVQQKGPETPYKVMNDYEQKIIHQATESCMAVDVNGNVLLTKDGTESSISFSDKEILMIKDAIFTHNHPSATSFSRQDLFMAENAKVSELRAVNVFGVYSIKPPKGGWKATYESPGKSKENLEDIINTYYNAVKKEFNTAILAGEMTIQYANKNHHHELWTRISKDYSFDYSFAYWTK